VPLSPKVMAAAGETAAGIEHALTELGARRKALAESTSNRQLSQLEQAMASSYTEFGIDGLPHSTTGPKRIRLLEMAAHDLRNPISGVLAASQFLIEDAAGRLEKHHLSMLRSMGSSSRIMLRLLEDMLEIAAISTARPRMHLQLTDIRTLVEQSLSMTRPASGTEAGQSRS
jgi:signal transduction histidine kinase